jgi:cytoskeletal protein CcmA (bactofilin family)
MVKVKGQGADGLNGFMDVGTEFVGELRFRDTFRVDGRVQGKIVSDNTLIVGESGQSGRVHGRQKIELLAGAKVQGTLVSPKLVIEEGAFFEGTCDMNAAAKRAVLPMPARAAGGPEGRS